jgi:lipoprotein-releasing system permease protein
MRNFSLYLALRYLRPKRTFVSVITVISVLGVCFGVAALIVVISVMRGFHQQIHELAMNFDAHIEAYDRWGTSTMDGKRKDRDPDEKRWREVLSDIRSTPGVTSASPTVRGMVLVEANGGSMVPAMMWGLEQEGGDKLAKKHENLVTEGTLDLRGDSIVVDENLKRSWGVSVGDKIHLYAPSNMLEMVRIYNGADGKSEEDKKKAFEQMREVVLPQEPVVTGIINPPKLQDSDKMNLIIVPRNLAQELLNKGDGITSIAAEVENPYSAGVVKKALLSKGLPNTWEAFTWMELHKQLFDTVQNELEMMYFVLFIIVLVAAFCVMNTMITVTVQKRREIGIISALGSRVGQIMWVFLIQGMIVGVLGAVTGFLAGWFVVIQRNNIRAGIKWLTGQEIFAQDIYGFVEIPAKIVGADITVICGGAFILCTLAALFPAYLAAKTEPAVALRD